MPSRIDTPIRVEIESRDGFWRNAVSVEWAHQFPARPPIDPRADSIVIDQSWFDELSTVAAKCFSRVQLSPADPGRRLLFRRLLRVGKIHE